MSHYFPPLVSACVTFVLTYILVLNKGGALQDIPNERSLHTKPIPRTGGIALMAGIISGWMFLAQSLAWWIVLPVLGLFALSLLDDARKLAPQTRLVGHLIAVLVAVSGLSVSVLWFIPALLFVMWMTNLYNFMDGSDGLAGGMALFGFCFYGMGAWLGGSQEFALLNFSVAAAALGFLFFNFYPAKVFMGDAGSIPLGFIAATFGLWGWQQGYWSFWFPLLVFSPFVADATTTLIKRTLKGKNLMQAHRSHYYQRLVQMGWGHRKTALVEYLLMIMAGASALWGIGMDAQGQCFLLVSWGGIYFGLMMWIDRCWQRNDVVKEMNHW